MHLEAKDVIGPIVAMLAVGVGIWQYRVTSKSEFIKPVREAQLRLYEDASSAAARIATLPTESPEWTASRQEFLRLFYGPLAIVEDFHHDINEPDDNLTVELAMIIFKSCLDDQEGCKAAGGTLLNLSLALAHTCRQSLGDSWGYAAKQLEGDYQKIALEYWKKYQQNRQTNQITEGQVEKS
jgi:hypothetical protein